MALLRRYHSFDNLDDGFFAMKSLLDSVERNQHSGIYLRSRGDSSTHDDFLVSVHPQSILSHQNESWKNVRNPLKAEKLLVTDSRRSAPSSVHRNFISRTRSLSPTRQITIRLTSEPASSVLRHFPLVNDFREAYRFYNRNFLSYDPIGSSQQKLQHFLETRQSTEKDIQWKIAESHRDLAALKKLISDTFGGNDYFDSYHSSNIDYGRSEYLPGVEQSHTGFKLDPEALLDTVERRRRHSPSYAHRHEYFAPIVRTNLESTPTTYDRSKQVLETFTKPRISDDSSLVVKITQNTSSAPDYGSSFYQKPQMPFWGHLGYLPLRPMDKYLFESPRKQTNYRHYISPIFASRYYYNDDSGLHHGDSLVPSLDLATTRSFRLRPEASYFTVDRRRHNQLVRHNLPGLYQNSRNYSAFPQRKTAVYAGHAFSPRYHYEVTRNVTRPVHYPVDHSLLTDDERMKLEKYEIHSFQPLINHYRLHKSHHYDSDNDPVQTDMNNNEELLHHHNYNRQYINVPTVSDTFRRRLARPAFSHHVRTRSLPPTYRWQSEPFVSTTTFPLTSTRAESTKPTGNLETLNKIMNELEESEDGPGLHGYNYHVFPRRQNVDVSNYNCLRHPDSYLFYRQLYKKNLSQNPQEINSLYANYLNESPSIYFSKADDYYASMPNTVFQDGRFFDHQVGMNSELLTPPTRVTKPESYLRRSASGEYARIISKQDFDPRYSFQRYSVV